MGSKKADGGRRFGAHMSIAGGLHLAVERAEAAGCDVLQIFVKNQRQWTAPPLKDEDADAWTQAWQASSIGDVMAHNSYLVNMASPKRDMQKKSIDAMVAELERCERLGVPGLVAHPGAHLGEGEDKGIKRIARALDTIHKRTAGYQVRILLETTAGTGTNLGFRFAHLARMIDAVREPERLAVCFDTCHVFAAGYDLATAEGYAATMEELNETVGLDRVVCFHVNDSMHPLGSRKDRHDHIGQGEMGPEPFRHLVHDRRFSGIPMFLETPKNKEPGDHTFDRMNLKTLRDLVGKPAGRATRRGRRTRSA